MRRKPIYKHFYFIECGHKRTEQTTAGVGALQNAYLWPWKILLNAPVLKSLDKEFMRAYGPPLIKCYHFKIKY